MKLDLKSLGQTFSTEGGNVIERTLKECGHSEDALSTVRPPRAEKRDPKKRDRHDPIAVYLAEPRPFTPI